eukprot:TRINITY_DN16323_c0_g2_i1.p1 TRINITY_DN16323_c0_g2~~TRINITY_DN16323_c0_g2_i1.p1  ORF type:complete len:1777 (+),score=376.56 TRINITY_DN16323_c0_g2_i1:175-5505(+)
MKAALCTVVAAVVVGTGASAASKPRQARQAKSQKDSLRSKCRLLQQGDASAFGPEGGPTSKWRPLIEAACTAEAMGGMSSKTTGSGSTERLRDLLVAAHKGKSMKRTRRLQTPTGSDKQFDGDYYSVDNADPKAVAQEVLESIEWPYEDGPRVDRFAGVGSKGDSPSGVPVLLQSMNAPTTMAVDAVTGSVYVGDAANMDIRKFVTTAEQLAEDPEAFTACANQAECMLVLVEGVVPVTEAERTLELPITSIGGLAWDETGEVYFSSFDDGRVFRMFNGTSLELIANSAGVRGGSGVCGPATHASYSHPRGLTIVPARIGYRKSLVMADSGNDRIQQIEITDWPRCLGPTDLCLPEPTPAPTPAPTPCPNALLCGDEAGAGMPSPPAPAPIPEKCCMWTDEFINPVNGSIAKSGDLLNSSELYYGVLHKNYTGCAFESPSPDACAFDCWRYGTEEYGAKKPVLDVVFNKADLVKLFNVSLGYFVRENLRVGQPVNWALAQPYSWIVTYDGGNTSNWYLPKGSRLVGMVRGGTAANDYLCYKDPGACNARRLFESQASATFLVDYVANLILQMRFEVPGKACKRWSWKETGRIDAFNRSGLCFMMPEVANLDGVYYCLENSTTSGTATCRPGRSQWIVGRQSLFYKVNTSAPKQPPKKDFSVNRRYEVSLQDPRGVHYYESSPLANLQSRPTLLIADTGNSRILGMPLKPQEVFHVRFWVHLSGDKAVEVFQDETRRHTLRSLFRKTFKDNHFGLEVVTFKGMSGEYDRKTGHESSDMCDGGQSKAYRKRTATSELYDWASKNDYRLETTSICDGDNATSRRVFGFGDRYKGKGRECCAKAVQKCAEQAKCDEDLYWLMGAITTAEMCQTVPAMRDCFAKAALCINISTYSTAADADPDCDVDPSSDEDFFQAVLNNIRPTDKAAELCQLGWDTRPGYDASGRLQTSDVYPCEGCDARIFSVLGGDPAFLNVLNASEVKSMLLTASFNTMREAHEMANNFAKLKADESFLNGTYTTRAQWEANKAEVQTGLPDMILDFHMLFHKLLVANFYKGREHNARITFSPILRMDGTAAPYYILPLERSTDHVYPLVVDPAYDNPITRDYQLVRSPMGLASDKYGRLYFSDLSSHNIGLVTNIWEPHRAPDEDIYHVAGTYQAGWNDFDNATADESAFELPSALAVNLDGDLHVADGMNHQIRTVKGLANNADCDNSRYFRRLLQRPTYSDLDNLTRTVQCREETIRNQVLFAIINCIRCCLDDTESYANYSDYGSCDSDLWRTQCAAGVYSTETHAPGDDYKFDTDAKCFDIVTSNADAEQLATLLVADIPTCESCEAGAVGEWGFIKEKKALCVVPGEMNNMTWDNNTACSDVPSAFANWRLDGVFVPCAARMLSENFVSVAMKSFTLLAGFPATTLPVLENLKQQDEEQAQRAREAESLPDGSTLAPAPPPMLPNDFGTYLKNTLRAPLRGSFEGSEQAMAMAEYEKGLVTPPANMSIYEGHDASKCRYYSDQHPYQPQPNKCCGTDRHTMCANGFLKVMMRRPCVPDFLEPTTAPTAAPAVPTDLVDTPEEQDAPEYFYYQCIPPRKATLEKQLQDGKEQICANTSALNYGFNMNSLSMALWSLHVQFACSTQDWPDGLISQHSKTAKKYGKLYSRTNEIPIGFMSTTLDDVSNTRQVSQCHFGCQLLQPSFFDLGDANMTAAQCCGNLGYRCKADEGQCHQDEDCEDGLICKAKSCSWGPGSCCAQGGASVEQARIFQVANKAVSAVGFDTITTMKIH